MIAGQNSAAENPLTGASDTRSAGKDNYNATVVSIRRCHDDLMILRVTSDQPSLLIRPGQYAVLGLGGWAPRVAGCQAEDAVPDRLIKRAYSVSCPLLDNRDRLVTVADTDFLEFYIALIRRSDNPPALTPRIFALREGDRIFCGPRLHGRYLLPKFAGDTTVVFAATGTGEAPHNAMIAQLLAAGHPGQIVNVTCVRRRADLGYLRTHRRLETLFPNYRYVTLTTREPENLDNSRADYIGKRYLQDYFANGDFQRDTSLSLDPQNTHVFLCGKPSMIGWAGRTPDAHGQLQTKGMIATLTTLGFRVDRPGNGGNVHYEKYW